MPVQNLITLIQNKKNDCHVSTSMAPQATFAMILGFGPSYLPAVLRQARHTCLMP